MAINGKDTRENLRLIATYHRIIRRGKISGATEADLKQAEFCRRALEALRSGEYDLRVIEVRNDN